jgi:hypothetical protein
MKDILVLENNAIKVEDKTVIINMQLSIREFADVYYQEDKKFGLMELSYVAFTCSYNSPLVIKGITGAELHDAACAKIGLPKHYVPSEKAKKAQAYFKEHYAGGVFGIITELYKSFEITRGSIEMLNAISYRYQQAIKQKLTGDIDDKVILELSKQLEFIINNAGKIRDINSSLDGDITKLKSLQAKIVAVETNAVTPLGGGSISKSANRTGN